MRVFLTITFACFFLIGCNGFYKKKQHHEKELHNQGVAIERHAPAHTSQVTQETARRASDVSNIAIQAGLK